MRTATTRNDAKVRDVTCAYAKSVDGVNILYFVFGAESDLLSPNSR